MRRKEPDRVLGPYPHRGGWRIVVVRGGQKTPSEVFATAAKAEKVKREIELELGGLAAQTYEVLLQQYLDYKITERGNSVRAAETDVARVRRFFEKWLEDHVRQLSARVAQERYAVLRTENTQYGKPISVAEQQATLKAARRFGKWLVKEQRWSLNPLLNVELAGGQPKAGEDSKRQLTKDQGRMWRLGALAMADDGDQGVLAALVCLLMGRRVTEVAALRVSALDDGGASLRVRRLKRRKQAIVTLPICDPDLQSALAEQARRARTWGRTQDVPPIDPPLFPPMRYRAGGKEVVGEHLSRYSIRRAVHRVCEAVGLPLITTHALRGTFASVGAEAGVAIETVAAALGNLPAVAARHYASEQSREIGSVLRLGEDEDKTISRR